MDNNGKLLCTRLRAVVSAFCAIVATVGGPSLRARPISGSVKSTPPASILAVPVKSFEVEHASMAEALLKLRSSDVSRVVIGFERVPHHEGENAGPISLALADTTLGEVVKRLCEADPRYEYEVIEGKRIDARLSGSMIEVRPKGAVNDPNDLLNMRIVHYKVDARTAGAVEAIESISQDAPELKQFLRTKHEEWVKAEGVREGGSLGSIMSGNMPPPPFVLELQNVTVRQILDAISLKSIQMWGGGQSYDARGMPLKSAPTGWEYDFIIHPNASTGLDGIPTWKAF